MYKLLYYTDKINRRNTYRYDNNYNNFNNRRIFYFIYIGHLNFKQCA